MGTPIPKLFAAFALVATGLAGCADAEGPALALDEPLPKSIPDDTELIVGDPETQVAMELSGEADKLPFDVEWANFSGGPQTSEAFRSDSLDVGAVADVPPIHAAWTDLPVKIVAARYRADPLAHPTYELGVAPGAKVSQLSELKGKRIAYSPGQAQGALVLRTLDKAGLKKSDVKLVEMPSTGDTYLNSLASKEIDVAPLANIVAKRYLDKYESEGAATIDHGLRDDPWHLYVRTETLHDSYKAGAIREYVEAWARAQEWIDAHPKEWIQGYYVDDQGLSEKDGEYLVKAVGKPEIPKNWDDGIARHQETIDLLAKSNGKPRLEAEKLYDRRYESVAAKAVSP